MPRKAICISSFNNKSNADGGKSPQDILITLDTNYSRAVDMLNTEAPTNSVNLRELNQNKATGASSEITTITQVNSGVSKGSNDADRHGDQSEQRGGSTMSDLHNTEYVDESRATRSPVSPKTKTNKGSETPRTPRRRKVEVVPEESQEDNSSEDREVISLPLPQPSSPPPTPKKRSKAKKKHAPPPSTQKAFDASSAVPSLPSSPHSPSLSPPLAPSAPKPPPQSETPSQALTAQKRPSIENKRTSLTGDRRSQRSSVQQSLSASTRSTTSEEETERESEPTGETDGNEETDSETYTGQPFMDPDPTAARDLDNASPKTIAMCNRHPCHYCFFVYFPSSSVDEDLMPFRRKAFIDKVARLQNPEHVREVMETKCARDAYTDRRITSIERQSGTEIRLSELNPSSAFIKGLPRRRLTIAGPTFAHIGCALNLFESLLPKVVKTGIFPYRLPEGSSTRFASGMRQSSHFQWSFGRQDGTVLLRNQLDDKGGWRGFLVPNKSEN
ncbi:hypothetical protein FGIG_01121 [Fasciola gigantica]|uniref:Uncharacterized protein n=1 Tax=Fasciola gigantica TaxID=46835 RepID=A0A504Y907_FASGI|nr:hypothetical protein FGIG_01121 [Fasciola gigantica]